MSGHKRIIETAAVLLATVLVFSRGYAEQRFQKQMETLLEEYETGEAQTDNLQLTNLRVNYIPDPSGSMYRISRFPGNWHIRIHLSGGSCRQNETDRRNM